MADNTRKQNPDKPNPDPQRKPQQGPLGGQNQDIDKDRVGQQQRQDKDMERAPMGRKPGQQQGPVNPEDLDKGMGDEGIDDMTENEHERITSRNEKPRE